MKKAKKPDVNKEETPEAPLQRIDTGHSYRIALWSAKIFGIMAATEFFIIAGLVALLLSLFPLKQVEPFFIALHGKEDQILRIEPFYQNTNGFKVLLEQFARAYVAKRETIDLQTEAYRWNEEIALMSSDEVFQRFRDQMDPKNTNSPLVKAEKNGLTRDVQIVSASAISENQFIVEFILTTRKKGTLEVVSRQRINAAMTFDLAEKVMTGDQRFINPIGFTVTAYSLAEKTS